MWYSNVCLVCTVVGILAGTIAYTSIEWSSGRPVDDLGSGVKKDDVTAPSWREERRALENSAHADQSPTAEATTSAPAYVAVPVNVEDNTFTPQWSRSIWADAIASETLDPFAGMDSEDDTYSFVPKSKREYWAGMATENLANANSSESQTGSPTPVPIWKMRLPPTPAPPARLDNFHRWMKTAAEHPLLRGYVRSDWLSGVSSTFGGSRDNSSDDDESEDLRSRLSAAVEKRTDTEEVSIGSSSNKEKSSSSELEEELAMEQSNSQLLVAGYTQFLGGLFGNGGKLNVQSVQTELLKQQEFQMMTHFEAWFRMFDFMLNNQLRVEQVMNRHRQSFDKELKRIAKDEARSGLEDASAYEELLKATLDASSLLNIDVAQAEVTQTTGHAAIEGAEDLLIYYLFFLEHEERSETTFTFLEMGRPIIEDGSKTFFFEKSLRWLGFALATDEAELTAVQKSRSRVKAQVASAKESQCSVPKLAKLREQDKKLSLHRRRYTDNVAEAMASSTGEKPKGKFAKGSKKTKGKDAKAIEEDTGSPDVRRLSSVDQNIRRLSSAEPRRLNEASQSPFDYPKDCDTLASSLRTLNQNKKIDMIHLWVLECDTDVSYSCEYALKSFNWDKTKVGVLMINLDDKKGCGGSPSVCKQWLKKDAKMSLLGTSVTGFQIWYSLAHFQDRFAGTFVFANDWLARLGALSGFLKKIRDVGKQRMTDVYDRFKGVAGGADANSFKDIIQDLRVESSGGSLFPNASVEATNSVNLLSATIMSWIQVFQEKIEFMKVVSSSQHDAWYDFAGQFEVLKSNDSTPAEAFEALAMASLKDRGPLEWHTQHTRAALRLGHGASSDASDFLLHHIFFAPHEHLDGPLKFLELDVGNGLSESKTYYFEKKRNWTGFLLEDSADQCTHINEHRDIMVKTHVGCPIAVCSKPNEVRPIADDVVAANGTKPARCNTTSGILKEVSCDASSDVRFFGGAGPIGTNMVEPCVPPMIHLWSLGCDGCEGMALETLDWQATKVALLVVKMIPDVSCHGNIGRCHEILTNEGMQFWGTTQAGGHDEIWLWPAYFQNASRPRQQPLPPKPAASAHTRAWLQSLNNLAQFHKTIDERMTRAMVEARLEFQKMKPRASDGAS